MRSQLLVLLAYLLLLLTPAKADPPPGPPQPPLVHHRHAPEDAAVHERFYSTWYMPDNPTKSCCSKADCYPTEIRIIGGRLEAKRREDGVWLVIPDRKIERHRDNPDGRNHLCAPPPSTAYPAGTVFCFALGGGT